MHRLRTWHSCCLSCPGPCSWRSYYMRSPEQWTRHSCGKIWIGEDFVVGGAIRRHGKIVVDATPRYGKIVVDPITRHGKMVVVEAVTSHYAL